MKPSADNGRRRRRPDNTRTDVTGARRRSEVDDVRRHLSGAGGNTTARSGGDRRRHDDLDTVQPRLLYLASDVLATFVRFRGLLYPRPRIRLMLINRITHTCSFLQSCRFRIISRLMLTHWPGKHGQMWGLLGHDAVSAVFQMKLFRKLRDQFIQEKCWWQKGSTFCWLGVGCVSAVVFLLGH